MCTDYDTKWWKITLNGGGRIAIRSTDTPDVNYPLQARLESQDGGELACWHIAAHSFTVDPEPVLDDEKIGRWLENGTEVE